MQAIWKYPLAIADVQEIEVPKHSTFVAVQAQANVPTLWLRVFTGNAVEKVRIRIYGTGHEHSSIPMSDYLGTVQIGALVWHVFGDFDHLERF